jgi:endonuclease/exonuclease/phosphatase family metal-dependent hydrolase
MKWLRVLLLLACVLPACGDDDDGTRRGADVTVAQLNILHGLVCPQPTENCRLVERMDLLFQWIAAIGCPDVVTFQEVWPRAFELISERAAGSCPFAYNVAQGPQVLGLDDETVLSRYPIVALEQMILHRDFRRALFVRVDHPTGPLEVTSTHLASSVDGATMPCGDDCPPECVAAGAATVRQCQAVQLESFALAHHQAEATAVLTGDFNEKPDSVVYQGLVGHGWTDVYLAAGNPECDPGTGVGCTSGRDDASLSHLESPASNQVERIDYIFLMRAPVGAGCGGSIDSGDDADGDGIATRIFSDDPNPFAPGCGPRPAAVCWPSDHEGMQLDLNCE